MPPELRKRVPRKFGIAATECAVMLPILLIIMAGTIEICSGLFLKETLTIAAYEGARIGVQRMATNDDVKAKAMDFLEERQVNLEGLSGDAVTISPNVATAPIFTPITVTVRAPTNGNTVLPFSWLNYFGGREMESEIVMRKEFSDVIQ